MSAWVFGYGSLMWNPEFDPAEAVLATLDGYSRSFCMRSVHHRGSLEVPGLVLALDAVPGARCRGVALRIRPDDRARVLPALRERELVSSAYVETVVPVTLDDGRRVDALAYVVDPHHAQYCGGLPLDEQARIIAEAIGGRGPNHAYLTATDAHLQELGIGDAELQELSSRVRRLRDNSLA